ncbi:MAG TPA: hypothetical protein VEG44_08585 [Candidatus Acidoferrales bacterium]|nr:hypothetical protein [Candidatus Acidoferrales bacterium]
MNQKGDDYSDNYIASLRNDISTDLKILSDIFGEDATKALDHFVISRVTLSLAEMIPQIIEYLDRNNVNY